MKFACSVVVVMLLAFTGVSYAGSAGVAEVPQQVFVGAGNVVSAAVAPVSGVFNPAGGCAYAPYEVKVQYTPIQPQAGECTYCTVLPYGCPDGAPYVAGGVCGSSCSFCGDFIDKVGCAIGEVLSLPFNVINCFICKPQVCSACN